MLSFKPTFSLSSFTFIKRLFSSSSLSAKGSVICVSEVTDISPGNLDSSLCFLQPSISHDVLSQLQIYFVTFNIQFLLLTTKREPLGLMVLQAKISRCFTKQCSKIITLYKETVMPLLYSYCFLCVK